MELVRRAVVFAVLCTACSAASGSSIPSGNGGEQGQAGSVSVAPITGGAGSAGMAFGSGGASLPGRGGAPISTVSNGGTAAVAAGGQTSSASGGQSFAGAPAGAGGRVTSMGGAPSSGGGAGAGVGGGAGGSSASTDVCTRWKADRTNLSEGTWSGNVTSCDAGDISPDARANALRVLNLYRFFDGLPAVTDDAARDAKDQQCALMMRANDMLSHSPPMSWTCWTQDGADAANGSNIGTAPAVASIDGYMLDPGNPTTLGHRRWVLSNSLGPVGIGGTDKSSCMMTLSGTGKAGKAWAAWPAPGSVPFQVMSAAHYGTVDATGWSIQSDTIDLSMAQVTVTSDGAPLAVTVTQLLTGYGSKYALRFNPMGWSTAAGKKYSVTVTGVTPSITYDVDMVDCG